MVAKWNLQKPKHLKKSRWQQARQQTANMLFVGGLIAKGLIFSIRTSKGLYKMRTIVEDSEPYVITGKAIDQDWIYKNRSELESRILDEMRNDGYIPVLDMTPGLKELSYNEQENCFEYTIEAYGYKVGPEKSKQFVGVLVQQGLVIGTDAKTVSIVEL